MGKKEKLDYILTDADILKNIIEAIPNPVFYKDVKGIYIGCNPEFCKFLGIAKSLAINGKVWLRIPKTLFAISLSITNANMSLTAKQLKIQQLGKAHCISRLESGYQQRRKNQTTH